VANAFQQGYLNSTTWAYEPSTWWVLDSGTTYVPGTILIGGYNPASVYGPIQWLPSSVDADSPDSWMTDFASMMINGTSIDLEGSQAEFVTGFQYIGLTSELWYEVCEAMAPMITYPGLNTSALICDITLSRQPYVPDFDCT
jgi:hypothetical protein